MSRPSSRMPRLPVRVSSGRLLLLAAFLLFLYVLLPRLGAFSDSFTVLGSAEGVFVLCAIGLLAITYALAAFLYTLLALGRLRFKETLLIQAASAFTNRVLPAGFGALALYVQYLRKHGHTTAQAVAIAGTNNTLGIIGHLLLLGCISLVAGQDAFAAFTWPRFEAAGWIAATAALLTGGLIFGSKRIRRTLSEFFGDMGTYFRHYRKRPLRLGAAMVCSLLLTGGYVTLFYTCTQALGLEVTLLQAFVVFTIGMVATTAVPTPGGLGGAEAGLTAGLVGFGVTSSEALAAALLYRFITYWLPLLPGFIVFLAIRKLYV